MGKEGPDNEGLKQIPDAAIRREEKGTHEKPDNLAAQEAQDIAKGALGPIDHSQEQNVLELHRAFRRGVKYLFFLSCAIMTYIALMLAYLICTHLKYVAADPTKLESLMTSIWHVLSGAALVSFVQLLGWLLKAQHDKSQRRRH